MRDLLDVTFPRQYLKPGDIDWSSCLGRPDKGRGAWCRLQIDAVCSMSHCHCPCCFSGKGSEGLKGAALLRSTVFLPTHTDTHTHTYTHGRTDARTHTHTHTHLHAHTYAHAHTNTLTCARAYARRESESTRRDIPSDRGRDRQNRLLRPTSGQRERILFLQCWQPLLSISVTP